MYKVFDFLHARTSQVNTSISPITSKKRLSTMHLYPYTSLFLTASAAIVPLQPRATAGDPCAVDPSGVGDLGPTADGTAGIGAEFESPAFYFENPKCGPEDTFAAKGKVVNDRTGDQWILSADTGPNQGKLNAEYILNGKKIKLGSGDGAKSGKDVADDLVSPFLNYLDGVSF